MQHGCRTARRLSLVWALFLLIMPLAGCGGRPMLFPVPESEMPPAPGLFTGETGTWEVPLARDKPSAQPGNPPAGGAMR